MNELKQKTHRLLSPDLESRPAKIVHGVIFTLIILNIAAIMLESIPSLSPHRGRFRALEIFSIAVFTVEYLARLWSCTVEPAYQAPVLGRLRYALRPMMVIDFIAIVPFFVPFLVLDLRYVRVFRLLRLFRVLRLARYMKDLNVMVAVLIDKKEELSITLLAGFAFLIASASLMYHLENVVQPENFSSIPAAMWWGIGTITGVGNGNLAPLTTGGKVLASIMAITGVGLYALPAGILGSGFIEELGRRKVSPFCCPHCGKEIEK